MYMAYGMTYEQFWYGDPWMVRAYSEAYLLKRKIENENMWILGAYVANAVSVAIHNNFDKKKVKYLEKPLELFPKTEAEKQAEIREEKRKLIEWLNMMKKASDRKRKEQGSDTDGEPRNAGTDDQRQC